MKERVQKLVDETPRILLEYESKFQTGTLPYKDATGLGLMFAERLRQQSDLAWIGFGDANTGNYVGATRRSGDAVRLYTAKQEVLTGIPVEEEVSLDGTRTVVASPETLPYRVRERPWFRSSMHLRGLSWLDIYTFSDGRRGVTAVLPLRKSENKMPVGILHVDVFIDTLENRLDRLKIGRTGRLHLLDRSGKTVASPRAWRSHDPILKEALIRLGGKAGLQKLNPGSESRFLIDHGSGNWRAAFDHVGIPGGPDWIVAVVAPEREFTGVARDNALLTMIAAALGLSLAAWLAIIVSRRIAEPLRLISQDLEKISLFIFDSPAAKPSFIQEVEVVRQNTARMKSSLRSFGRYIPADLVRELLLSGHEAELGGTRHTLTVQFSDIAGFTTISEKISAECLVEELGLYFSLMTESLQMYGGTLDKYMGDGIMAFFNAPRAVAQHEAKACLAALESQRRLTTDRKQRRAGGRPEFRARIGLASGEVIIGNIGTPERFAYTVIGDVVNLASRLEALCKFYGVSIIACARVRAATGDTFEWRALDRVAVVGRSSGTAIYELLGTAGDLAEEARARRDAYESALKHYYDGCFEQARKEFLEISRHDPDDLAAQRMGERAERLFLEPSKENWTGIFVHTQK